MIGFHIDMNMAQYRVDYLKRWLARLAYTGYDTILWEVENSVEWETCPECASPDAISKAECRALIDECRNLGLEPIPLFQTIGHAEYVLKHDRYAHLRELPDKIDQYCPRHPELIPFLHRWMDEYFEVFGPVKYFHLGADEAWWIGRCPRCCAYAEEHSISDLYIDHVSQIAQPLIERGVTPILWADMLLHYPQALDRLSRQIMLFDWVYWVYRGSGTVQVWGQGTLNGDELRALEGSEFMERFGPYLFPHGDEPGQRPETFYSADYLAAQGFQVVTCPSASSYGDNVFSPRNWLHLSNTFDSFKKGMQPHLHGTMLTSWSVHLFPWELQWPSIAVPAFLKHHPTSSLNKYPAWFERHHFKTGEATPEPTHIFWKAAGLLSKSCLFTHTASLGFDKAGLPVPADHVEQTLRRLAAEGQLEQAADQCRRRLAEYEASLRMFESFSLWISHDGAELTEWKLAALNLVHRAKTSLFLLEHASDVIAGRALASEKDRRAARQLLDGLTSLRNITQGVYDSFIRPQRACMMVEYMFGALERTLATLAG